MVIVYRRLTSALIFNRSVYYATTGYELMIVWLFLCFSMQKIGGEDLTLVNLGCILASGIFITGLSIYLSENRRLHDMLN